MAYRMRSEETEQAAGRTKVLERSETRAVSPLQLQALKSPEAVLALQRLAGNKAVVQRIWNPFADTPAEKARKEAEKARQDEMRRIAASPGYSDERLARKRDLVKEGALKSAVIGGGAGSGIGTGDMGIGSEIIGAASLVDAGMTGAFGYMRRRDALKPQPNLPKGDIAGASLGEGKMRSAGWGASSSTTATTQAGVNIGREVGTHGLTALGTAAGALGVVGGGITTLQGLWRMYKAAGKLSSLADRSMYTPEGEKWKDRVVNREQWKLGVGGLKVLLGALGIAAGALLIASNPVGWAVGIAAAAAGGVWALSKIGGKISAMRDRRNARQEVLKRDPDGAKTKNAKELADQVARECSENARTAGAMVAALKVGDSNAVLQWRANVRAMERTVGVATPRAMVRPKDEDKRNFDSFSLLGVLNIEPEEALTPSGQERIEKKLSVADSA